MARAWNSLKKMLMVKGQERGFKTEFAKRLGVAPQAVQRYFAEEDETVPSLDQAEKMAEIIGFRWELLQPEVAKQKPSRSSLLGEIVLELGRLDQTKLPGLLGYIRALGGSLAGESEDLVGKKR